MPKLIVVQMRLKALPGKKKEVLQTLQYMARHCREMEGCTAAKIFQDMGDEDTIVATSTWRTREAMKAYLKSESYEILTGMGKTLCASMQPSFFATLEGGGSI